MTINYKPKDKIYVCNEKGVRFFFIIGIKSALLIDSGMNTRDAKDRVKRITGLPIYQFYTHADPDHIGSCEQFSTFYMSPDELDNYNAHGGKGKIMPLKEGDKIDLGTRVLEVIEIPGHTPGSLALLDEKRRIIITGDTVQDGNIFMFGPMRSMETYRKSLDKLKALKGRYDKIYPSHGKCPLDASFVDDLILETDKVMNGQIEGTPVDMFGGKVKLYKTKVCSFLLPEDYGDNI